MHGMRAVWLLTALTSVTIFAGLTRSAPQSSQARRGSASDAAFQQHVAPILKNVCSNCHNDRLASGGLNVLPLGDVKTLKENRDTWEAIVRKVRAGDMPPRGMPRPSPSIPRSSNRFA